MMTANINATNTPVDSTTRTSPSSYFTAATAAAVAGCSRSTTTRTKKAGDDADRLLFQSDAFRQWLQLNDKKDLLEALQTVPELVAAESPLSRFLRAVEQPQYGGSSSSPMQTMPVMQAACKKLAAYWKLRREIFQERAMLPLSLLSEEDSRNAGSNASVLTAQDMEVIQTGAISILPKDRMGRTVLTLDHSKFLPSKDGPCHLAPLPKGLQNPE